MKKKSLFIISTYLICISLLAITYIVANKYNIDYKIITGDPLLTYNAHPFTGIISNIGVLLWCIASSICLFSGLLLLNENQKKTGLFLISSGILTFVLLIDDFFMFHDYIFYSFKQFKITQPITYTTYGVLTLWYIYTFIRTILKTNYILLCIAFAFLGLSVIVDLVFESKGFQYFIEDGLKFIGIISWMLYFSTTSFKLLSKKH